MSTGWSSVADAGAKILGEQMRQGAESVQRRGGFGGGGKDQELDPHSHLRVAFDIGKPPMSEHLTQIQG